MDEYAEPCTCNDESSEDGNGWDRERYGWIE